MGFYDIFAVLPIFGPNPSFALNKKNKNKIKFQVLPSNIALVLCKSQDISPKSRYILYIAMYHRFLLDLSHESTTKLKKSDYTIFYMVICLLEIGILYIALQIVTHVGYSFLLVFRMLGPGLGLKVNHRVVLFFLGRGYSHWVYSARF